MRKKLMAGLLVSASLLQTAAPVFATEDIKIEIVNTEAEAKSVEEEVSKLLNDISQLNEDIKANTKEITNRKLRLSEQARSLQTKSMKKASAISAVLSANNISELLKNLSAMTKIAEANNSQIISLADLVEKHNKLVEENKDNLKSLEEKQKELNERLEQLNVDLLNEEERQRLEANKSVVESLATVIETQETQLEETVEYVAAVTSQSLTEETVEQIIEEAPQQTTEGSTNGTVGSRYYAPNQAREAFDQILIDYNVPASEAQIWAEIITKESNWDTTVWNFGGSGAYGLGQALPAGKMAEYGSDYMTNPYTQLVWMYHYVHGRYGSFAGVNWYSRGWY